MEITSICMLNKLQISQELRSKFIYKWATKNVINPIIEPYTRKYKIINCYGNIIKGYNRHINISSFSEVSNLSWLLLSLIKKIFYFQNEILPDKF